MRRIHVLTQSAIEWPFHGEPIVRLPGEFHARVERVDPFPGYSHDRDVAAATIEAVEAAYPLPESFAPLWILLSVDTPALTNGWAERDWDYRAEPPDGDRSQRPWRGRIVLAGKRIPPHPAVTRYLVAHEYGHIVHGWLQRLAGEEEHDEAMYRAYAKVRGLRPPKSYGGGTWHRSTSEVFANDFRILVAVVEPDYWPHPGVPRPEAVPAIAEWWRDHQPPHR